MATDELASKGRRTPRRSERQAKQRERATAMRSWMQERLAALRTARAIQVEEPPKPRHGVTRLMRNIRKPEPQWVVKHEHANAQQRRHFPRPGGGVGTWPPELREPGRNVPYVNPDRDSKRHRRLRRDT